MLLLTLASSQSHFAPWSVQRALLMPQGNHMVHASAAVRAVKSGRKPCRRKGGLNFVQNDPTCHREKTFFGHKDRQNRPHGDDCLLGSVSSIVPDNRSLSGELTNDHHLLPVGCRHVLHSPLEPPVDLPHLQPRRGTDRRRHKGGGRRRAEVPAGPLRKEVPAGPLEKVVPAGKPLLGH